MCAMRRLTAFPIPYGFTCHYLEKELKAELGYDPIVNKIGEGYRIGDKS